MSHNRMSVEAMQILADGLLANFKLNFTMKCFIRVVLMRKLNFQSIGLCTLSCFASSLYIYFLSNHSNSLESFSGCGYSHIICFEFCTEFELLLVHCHTRNRAEFLRSFSCRQNHYSFRLCF